MTGKQHANSWQRSESKDERCKVDGIAKKLSAGRLVKNLHFSNRIDLYF